MPTGPTRNEVAQVVVPAVNKAILEVSQQFRVDPLQVISLVIDALTMERQGLIEREAIRRAEKGRLN